VETGVTLQVHVCTNCAMLMGPGVTECLRCGQPVIEIKPDIPLAPLEESEFRCAAHFHYVPEGASACRCGVMHRRGQ
jgi:hypothetical protein